MKPSPIENVINQGLCTGCGLCESIYGSQSITMALSNEGYARPQIIGPLNKNKNSEFNKLCPGISLNLIPDPQATVHPLWGPILSCNVGYSTNEEIRYKGSSGGVLTGLLVYLLETKQISFVLHVIADPEKPTENRSVISRTAQEIIHGAGSRYCPSSPLSKLQDAFNTNEKFAFVGKPCDAAGLRAYLTEYPKLQNQVVLIASFMCAGMPSQKGTQQIIHKLGIENTSDVSHFRFRGEGWPGFASATTKDKQVLKMDYQTSWGTILNRHLQFRCKICPDGTGEFADIVGADAWHSKDGYPDFEEQDGRSLILARTVYGQQLLEQAKLQNRIHYTSSDLSLIEGMQPYQANRKKYLMARMMAMFLVKHAWPRFYGLRVYYNLIRNNWIIQVKNFLGMLYRLGLLKK